MEMAVQTVPHHARTVRIARDIDGISYTIQHACIFQDKIPESNSSFCSGYDGADSWTHELTHMYFENATYNHLNHTNWL